MSNKEITKLIEKQLDQQQVQMGMQIKQNRQQMEVLL